MSILGERLRELRFKYNYSQKTVATRLGIAQSMVSAYESGEKEPSLKNLKELSYLYNCSTDYLLGIDKSKAELSINADKLTDKQLSIIYALLESWNYDSKPTGSTQ